MNSSAQHVMCGGQCANNGIGGLEHDIVALSVVCECGVSLVVFKMMA